MKVGRIGYFRHCCPRESASAAISRYRSDCVPRVADVPAAVIAASTAGEEDVVAGFVQRPAMTSPPNASIAAIINTIVQYFTIPIIPHSFRNGLVERLSIPEMLFR
jgi:hypothetical protein